MTTTKLRKYIDLTFRTSDGTRFHNPLKCSESHLMNTILSEGCEIISAKHEYCTEETYKSMFGE